MIMSIPNAAQRMWGNGDGNTHCWWEFKMDKAGFSQHVRAMGPRRLMRILRQKSWRLFSLLVYLYLLGKPTSLFFSKSSWSFSIVFLSMKLTTSISPDVGLGSAGEGGYRTEGISAECHRLGRPRPRPGAQAPQADPGSCLCHAVLASLNFQKEEEICLRFSSLGEHLSRRWESDLQLPDLGGMEENFLSPQVENSLQPLRWYDIYPHGVNTYFLGSFGCNDDSRYCFRELKSSPLSGAGPARSGRHPCAGPACQA